MSNKETLQSYNERLTTNNLNLEKILDDVNKLPDKLVINNASFLFYEDYRNDVLFDLLKMVNPNCEMYYRTFSGSELITEIPQLSGGSTNYVYQAFADCVKLEKFGGFVDLGKAYLPEKQANYLRYQLDFSASTKLTYASLMNVINGVYDIKSLGCKTQQLVLGSENLAKLTADEIAKATNKGWTVS